MTQTTEQDRAEFEAWLAPEYSREKWHTGEYTDDYVYGMFAAWKAARRAPVVPQGWKLVPEVPTMEMVASGDKSHKASSWLIGGANVVPATYAAMLAAAPQPPKVTPVQLSEPDICTLDHFGLRIIGYTPKAVRHLLAQHGVK